MKQKMKRRRWSGIRRAVLLTACSASMVLSGTVGGQTVITALASDKEVETVYLGQPRHVWWETDTVAKWSSVSKAHEYQVKLFIADDIDRDEENWRKINMDDDVMTEAEAVATMRTSELSCDFSEYMNDLHSYFFVVRAVPKVSEQAYVVSGAWTASYDIDYRGRQVQGITTGKWRNYLEGSKYETEDGSFLTAGWQLIKGNWYLLDQDGYRLTGWQETDGKKYYLSSDGKMASGWFVWEDNWYYAGEDGQICTGWIMTEPGKYYYLGENGVMLADTVVDGYRLDADGLRRERSQDE